MDYAEKVAEHFLRSLNIGDVVYEPDGNVPPDFVVNNNIAVEVRRLNQNFIDQKRFEGLEHLSIRLLHFFEKICITSGSPREGSYFLHWNFQRPLNFDSALIGRTRRALSEFDYESIRADDLIAFKTHNLTVRILPASEVLETKLLIGGFTDFDAGGWIGDEYRKNIILACEEKHKKIEHHRKRYEEWWLILPDFFWSSIKPDDYKAVPDDLCERFMFKRIVVVSTKNPSHFCDVGQ